MTDVNIAVELFKGAAADRYDTALLITGDSDLVPAVSGIREIYPLKREVVAFPPKRVNSDLKKHATHSININSTHLKKSQLPDEVRLSSGFVLRKPPEWN